jgi:hypothetical protein
MYPKSLNLTTCRYFGVLIWMHRGVWIMKWTVVSLLEDRSRDDRREHWFLALAPLRRLGLVERRIHHVCGWCAFVSLSRAEDWPETLHGTGSEWTNLCGDLSA